MSSGGVRGVWSRHGLTTKIDRLLRLEETSRTRRLKLTEEQIHALERFTTKGPGEGVGLGMAVVYGLVKQHRGFIAVESNPGEGTTVYVYFPPASETKDRTATIQR